MRPVRDRPAGEAHARPLLAVLLALVLGGCAATAPKQEPEAPESAQESPEETRPDDASAPGDSADAPDEPPEQPPADTAEAAAQESAEEAEETPRPRGLTGQNLYRLLVADLAGRQGDLGVALQGYLETARESRDPRVAQRATQLALYAEREDAALEAARRWAELAPADRDAHTVLARLYLRGGDVDAATTELRRVIELSDGVDAGLDKVAAIVGGSGKAETALAAMERIAADHADRAVAHYALGDLAAGLGRTERALTALERALEIEPSHSEALVLRGEVLLEAGRAEEAFAALRGAYRQYPDDRAVALGYVRLLIRAGRVEQGREQMQQVHERFGDDPDAVYSLALLAMQAEIWTDARLYLERLIQMDARTSPAHYYLGRIAQQQEECTEALRHYIKVGDGEHRFDAELRAAVCMARVDRIDEARLHLERMRSRYQAEQAIAQIVTTRARVERIGGNPGRALDTLGNGVERFPENNELRYARALAAAQMDRFELARSDLNAILEREPDNPRALNALGYMLADRGLELERARRMIERALEQNPDDAATIDSMGWVLYRLGRDREALEYLRRAWELDPGAEIAAHLGEVLWALGRRDEARRIWDQARERQDDGPGNEVLRETVDRLTR